ncbi:hypothetical protein [Jiella sp. M17.18]|uniref:hypothetical protein n=1 Tax=Jiella sp. M17.18 TaxID=3234247 RepID=UPI0034E01255
MASLQLLGSTSISGSDDSRLPAAETWRHAEGQLAAIASDLHRESATMRDWLVRSDAELDRIENDNEENKRLLSDWAGRQGS